MTTMILKRAARQLFLPCLAILGFTGVGFAQPSVKLGTRSGPPTTTVLVSGSGFAADALIDIYFDTTDEVLALANGSGAFSKIALVVPASAQPGDHWVSAVQRSSDTGAQVAFDVQTNWSEVGFSSKGKRSNPYENVLSPVSVGAIDLHWAYTTGSYVYSSPAVANGVVYVGSYDDNVYALNATTGAKLWSYTTGSYVSSSPVVANGVVYVGSYDDNVYAFDQVGGTLVRTKQQAPDLSVLRPDLTLKPSRPVTELTDSDGE